jgi:hypothetical protein
MSIFILILRLEIFDEKNIIARRAAQMDLTKKSALFLTPPQGYAIFTLVNTTQARDILLNELRDIKAYDEYLLIRATRVWFNSIKK